MSLTEGPPAMPAFDARPDTSQPILERLGFRAVCDVELLRDRT